jgi:hypothetical protein
LKLLNFKKLTVQNQLNENTKQKQPINTTLAKHALQDVLANQPTVLIGLISKLTGSALQDDIALTIGRMQQLGNDILYQPNHAKGGPHAKRLICPQRIRKVPKHFSWVDHRLVRDHYIDQLSHKAATLYLFLVTVADAQGLSYYSDVSILQHLNMDDHTLDVSNHRCI